MNKRCFSTLAVGLVLTATTVWIMAGAFRMLDADRDPYPHYR